VWAAVPVASSRPPLAHRTAVAGHDDGGRLSYRLIPMIVPADAGLARQWQARFAADRVRCRPRHQRLDDGVGALIAGL
jgi:hypothetical protein